MPIRGFLDLRGADKTILRHCRLCAPATKKKYYNDNNCIRRPRGGLRRLALREIAAFVAAFASLGWQETGSRLSITAERPALNVADPR